MFTSVSGAGSQTRAAVSQITREHLVKFDQSFDESNLIDLIKLLNCEESALFALC